MLNMSKKLNKSRKLMLAAVAFGGLLLWGTSGSASAADARPACDQRLRQEQFELDRAVARHGFYSRQADHERREIARLRYECGYRDRWR